MRGYLLILKEYHILLCKTMAKPSKKKRHEVISERSKANWSKTAARSGTS